MTSKDALYFLITNQKKFRDGFKFVNLKTHETATVEDCYDTIMRDLEVLEILKKCNFDIDYEDGYDDKFILGTRHYVEITQEDYEKIKEWLENE